MPIIRLDKYLSEMECASRSDVKKYIKSGRVKVDNEICLKAETKINTDINKITLDLKEIKYEKFSYIMLNKPAGVVSATEDKIDKTVIDLIDKEDMVRGLFPVGRLDKDTVGLLILTNDGDFAHNTLSPKKHINKTYYVEVDGKINEDDLEKFRNGIIIKDKDKEEVKLKSANLEVLDSREDLSKAIITISEGKYHQIKKMFLTVDKKVTYLKRIKFGEIQLDSNLKEGQYRKLNEEEMQMIKSFLK